MEATWEFEEPQKGAAFLRIHDLYCQRPRWGVAGLGALSHGARTFPAFAAKLSLAHLLLLLLQRFPSIVALLPLHRRNLWSFWVSSSGHWEGSQLSPPCEEYRLPFSRPTSPAPVPAAICPGPALGKWQLLLGPQRCKSLPTSACSFSLLIGCYCNGILNNLHIILLLV